MNRKINVASCGKEGQSGQIIIDHSIEHSKAFVSASLGSLRKCKQIDCSTRNKLDQILRKICLSYVCFKC